MGHHLRLIHWNEAEAAGRVAELRALGHRVSFDLLDPEVLRALKSDPPDAFVIDLTRLPSHGRDLAVGLRSSAAARQVPLVFVEGEPQKVARIRDLLPDAVYTTWQRIAAAVEDAIAHPPRDPVVPDSALAGYSGTPLPKKLGIKPGSVVVLLDAPDGFEETLGGLPDGVELRWANRGRRDLTIWFVTARGQLERKMARVAAAAGSGLWIAWPKKASGVPTDVTEDVVREAGLAAGLVDHKIAAIDRTWSGLRFARRKDG